MDSFTTGTLNQIFKSRSSGLWRQAGSW